MKAASPELGFAYRGHHDQAGCSCGYHRLDFILHTPGACRTQTNFWKLHEGMTKFRTPHTPKQKFLEEAGEPPHRTRLRPWSLMGE